MDAYALNHRGHDYDALIARWHELPLHLTQISMEGNYPVWAVENSAAKKDQQNGIYLSAGVHGDECAPVWALLEWVEENLSLLTDSSTPFLLFPCLNPHGLVENRRNDHRGNDLNRLFQNTGHSLIGPWQKFIEGRKFRFTANLHEDYDARGIYLYQLPKGDIRPGDEILTKCAKIIPRDTRSDVEGVPFKNGLLTRSGDLSRVVEAELGGGYPEAIWLYQHHLSDSACAHTFETPSEFSLTERVNTHRRFLECGILPLI